MAGIWQLGKKSVEREDKHVCAQCPEFTGLTEAGESEGLLRAVRRWSVRLCVSERHARHRSFDSLVDSCPVATLRFFLLFPPLLNLCILPLSISNPLRHHHRASFTSIASPRRKDANASISSHSLTFNPERRLLVLAQGRVIPQRAHPLYP